MLCYPLVVLVSLHDVFCELLELPDEAAKYTPLCPVKVGFMYDNGQYQLTHICLDHSDQCPQLADPESRHTTFVSARSVAYLSVAADIAREGCPIRV